jgi:multidrug transporter EmrE-like cation transporter
MIEVTLILFLLLGVGIFARSYDNWTRLMMVLIIIGVMVLFYLT